jgi:Lon protease-like protein
VAHVTTTMPMFPLGSVLLPGAPLPLHVFEPRYRALVQDCLEGPREFGVVLIERGSEVGGGDVRTDVGTVARILEVARFEDGRWALAAVGTRRIRVVGWLEDDPYPRAEVVDWPDDDEPLDDEAVEALVAPFRRVLALATELGLPVPPATAELAPEPLVALLQMVAATPVGPMDRQRLLLASGPGARSELLAELLADAEVLLEARVASGDAGGLDGEGNGGGPGSLR